MKILIILFFVINLFAENITLNLQNVKIKDFIQMIAKITNKNILISVPVRGTINFVSVKPIPKKDLMDLVISILETKGLTIIDTHKGYYKVIRSKDAIRENPSLSMKSESIITQTIPLRYISVQDALVKVKPFLSRDGTIIPSTTRNLLIVVDYKQNIQTIRKIIWRLDVAPKKITKFIKLYNANVDDIYNEVLNIRNSLFNQNIKKQQISILKNKNTNSLILIGRESLIEKLTPYIQRLDYKDKLVQPTTKIFYIKNNDADQIAKILTDLYAKKQYSKKDIRPSFIYNKELNNIVVSASVKDIQEIAAIINAIDSEKPQVFVKIQILEISENKAKKLGSEFGMSGASLLNGAGLFSFASDLGGTTIPDPTLAQQLASTLGNIKEGLLMGATIHLLKTFSVAKVLSEPSILCINNQESSIYVGKTISVLVSSTQGDSTTSVTRNNYERQDIGLTLKVKPRISSDNKVVLDIKIVAEEAQGTIVTDKPITTKREVATNAIVQNGETVVLGGLIKQNDNSEQKKVPFLGDIPVLGHLFKYNYKNNDKTSLVLLVTPYIIKKSSDLEDFREKLREYEKLQDMYNKEIEKRLKKQ